MKNRSYQWRIQDFCKGGCGSWCLWSAPSPFMPSLPPTLKKISWELAAR